MRIRQALHIFLTFGQQPHFDATTVFGRAAAFHETHLLAARYQRNDTMVLRLQTLGDLADGRPFTAGITLDVEQHQILQRGDARLAGELLGKAQEPANLIAEIGKRFKILLRHRG